MYDDLFANQPEASDADLRFIMRHRLRLSRIAQTGYAQLGRGIVIVEQRHTLPFEIAYARYEEVAQLGVNVMVAMLLDILQRYDPPHETVCLIVRDDTVARVYRYCLADTPAAALASVPSAVA